VVKRGFQNGVQRWYCKDCQKYFNGQSGKKEDLALSLYSTGYHTVQEISQAVGVSRMTIHRYLSSLQGRTERDNAPREIVALMDTTYWGRSFGVVVIKDNISGRVIWHKFIGHRERLSDYREGVEWLESRGYAIKGIVSDGLKGLSEMFPQYRFQLCQFHQIQSVRIKLTGHPKLPASMELLDIARMMTRTDKETFCGALDDWHMRWPISSERSASADGKTFYTHRRLRSAYLSLKRNMPRLWTFYDYPELEMPNTNNAIEALFSDIKTKLRIHKGLSLERRKSLIAELLNAHNPHK